MLSFPKVFVLAAIQGATELLPVSSSAHVIVAEKLMGLDPTTPAMTFLLVMLHTGTMFSVLVFFWNSWKQTFFQSENVGESVKLIGAATLATAFVGLLLKVIIEKIFLKGYSHPEIELIFGNMLLIAASLAVVGALILCTGFKKDDGVQAPALGLKSASLIGMVQGLCLPFRGFSRSGSTISTGLILGIEKKKMEDFSFALAVVLTPPVILQEGLRFLKAQHGSGHHATGMMALFLPGLMGMVLSFISGFLALKWLSRWLEQGRWYFFGFYCLAASAAILLLYVQGLV